MGVIMSVSIREDTFGYSYRAQWCTPLIPALMRKRQADLCEFTASVFYTVDYRTARATQKNGLENLKIKTKQNKQTPHTYHTQYIHR